MPKPFDTGAGAMAASAAVQGIVQGPLAAKSRSGRAAKERHRSGNAKRDKAPEARERSARKDKRDPGDSCEEAGLIALPKSGLCTHGGDPAPPGFDVDQRVRALSPAKVRAATAGTESACTDDGTSGNRVQALYVHAEGTANRYGQYSGSFQAWLAGADQILLASAAEAGGARRFRFVMTGGCQVDVQQVALPASAVASFDQMLQALQQRGFNRQDRFYFSFVDATNTGYCGLGTLSSDDRPGQENLNNRGPSYSRVDSGCWGEVAIAHELMHNLGGVLNSAPHSTGYGHCIDDFDVMCYQDGTSRQVQIVCADSALDYRYDCGKDDYFHPNPAPGSYLDLHWNTANSSFLSADGQVLRADSVQVTSPRPGVKLKGKKKLTVSAEADARSGVTSVEFRFCKGSNCSWDSATPMGNDFSTPFSASRKLPKKGSLTLLAAMTTASGHTTVSEPVSVKVK